MLVGTRLQPSEPDGPIFNERGKDGTGAEPRSSDPRSGSGASCRLSRDGRGAVVSARGTRPRIGRYSISWPPLPLRPQDSRVSRPHRRSSRIRGGGSARRSPAPVPGLEDRRPLRTRAGARNPRRLGVCSPARSSVEQGQSGAPRADLPDVRLRKGRRRIAGRGGPGNRMNRSVLPIAALALLVELIVFLFLPGEPSFVLFPLHGLVVLCGALFVLRPRS